jgi:hypothetical protein
MSYVKERGVKTMTFKTIFNIGSLIVGAVAGAWILRDYLKTKNGAFHFTEEAELDKNFGAFPPEIPEQQFENWLFV